MNENINDNVATSESQVKAILAYMRQGYKITPMDALRKFSCFRLGARIKDIEEIVGYPPHRDRVQVENASGKQVWVARYWL